eukprot:TRINITY_DN30312_c0_g1_i1.p1 TRINITY_DN30312_c0_g1~~TRINITY_DN30312_c0_g1_i1.p1  ORF type:complete len:581 (+),score=87.67 TRINITY_DN30312_c0_g1_i1:137-1744(+)
MRNLIIAGHHSGCNCIICLKALANVTGMNYIPCQHCPENGVHQQCNHHKYPVSSASITAASSSHPGAITTKASHHPPHLQPHQQHQPTQTTFVQLIPADSYVISFPTGASQHSAPSSSSAFPLSYQQVTGGVLQHPLASSASGSGFIYTSQPHQAVYEYLVPPTTSSSFAHSMGPTSTVQQAYSCTYCGALMTKSEVSSHVCRISAPSVQSSQIINVQFQDSINPVVCYSTQDITAKLQQVPPLKSTNLSGAVIQPSDDPIAPAQQSKFLSTAAPSTSPLHQCTICKRRCKTLEDLEKHSHDHEEKPFKCDICSKSFRQRRNLARHVRTHSQVKPFSCSVCGWSFRRKSNLAAHERIHSGMKPFVCEECGKSFRQKGSLSSHIRTHTKEKPHECAVCGDLFTRKGSLQRHVARFHPSLQELDLNELSSPRRAMSNPRSQRRSFSASSESHTTHQDSAENSSDEEEYVYYGSNSGNHGASTFQSTESSLNQDSRTTTTDSNQTGMHTSLSSSSSSGEPKTRGPNETTEQERNTMNS